ncbi:Hypothetical predicted protein [Mytilus galloprovincialis]|uniref:XK-related protein n=1 Tax=Mytilus galloprovincialis TaxID=29158 RepID=A0A8B6CYP3_MYTGA|nr:Hypothetical predicted protein [Mytilus galloprovincialis]
MTTASNWDFTTTPYYLNCTKTGTSLINNTITTPFQSFETTTYDALSTSSETIKIISMVCAIFGMVMLIILYAGCYRMCCSGNQPYHDSCIKAIIHIVLTLLTYVLYLFDTLSDVFLFLHYIAIGQTSKFALVMAFTFAPVLFLAFIFFAKHHTKYAQVLARGKTNFKFEYLTSYITLVEATLESAPQLTVQIYLLIIDSHTDTTYTGNNPKQILRTCRQKNATNLIPSFTNRGQFDNHGFQDGQQTYNFHDGQVASPYDIDSQYANDSQMQAYCGYERNNQPVYRYPREEQHVTQSYESDVNNRWNSEPYQNISQQSQQIQQYNMNPLQQWNDYRSQRGWYESNMSNRQTHFASSFHNQTFVGNVSSSYQSSMQSMTQGAVFTGTQYNSQGEYRFSGY